MAYELTNATDNAAVRASLGVREALAANRTYYVRADGSDANNGLANTAGGAFLTLQKAYDTIAAKLDLAGFTATIQVGAVATFTAGIAISQPWTGGGAVVIDLGGGTINSDAAGCLTNTATLPGTVTIQNGTLTTSANGTLINNQGPGVIKVGAGITFGSAGGGDHMSARGAGASVLCTSNYSITGGARYHMLTQGPALITSANLTVTITGTPAFANAFAGTQGGQINAYSNTYTGAATGLRYTADRLGLIDARGGATYLPGGTAGTATNGGVYV